MFNLFKKNKPIKEQEEVYDRDIQLIGLLKSLNESDKTLGKVDELQFAVMQAEVESIGMRMVERRTAEVEQGIHCRTD